MRKKSLVLSFVLLFQAGWAASIIGSKHDLSTTNYYGPYSGATTQICVFCHTPHGGNVGFEGPLWNRKISDTTTFTLYDGTTGKPNNPSMVCLSCHDGVSAEGDMSAVNAYDTHNIVNNPGSGLQDHPVDPNCKACHIGLFGGPGGTYPGRAWRIGPDLRDDHPVSVSYASAEGRFPGQFSPVASVLAAGLKLPGGNVECVSCHDVHDPGNGRFLRLSNDRSSLCKKCHLK
ncbi:cytochrome c3 family protein [Hydrogenimonas sp.]